MKPDIEGMEELNQRFEEMKKNGAREVREAVRQSVLNVRRLARQNVPVGTGALRESIRHELSDTGLSGKVIAGGPDAPYAVYVEFGRHRMHARPFMYPALEYERPQLRRRLIEAIQKSLDEVT